MGSKVQTTGRGSCLTTLLWSGGFVFVAFALAYAQYRYARAKEPEIAALVAQATQDGPRMVEAIGAPPGATVYEPLKIEPRKGSRRSKWSATTTGVLLTAAWEAPGTPESVLAWFRERLETAGVGDNSWDNAGWRAISQPYPSAAELDYESGRWQLRITSNEWWGGTDAHARVRLSLDWNWGR